MNNLIGADKSRVQFDIDNYDYYEQSEVITIPANSGARKGANISLNREYTECIGIATYETSANQSTKDWKLGVDYRNGNEIFAPTVAIHWISQAINQPKTLDFSQAFKPCKFSIEGSLNDVNHKWAPGGAALANELELNVVFLLRRPARNR